MWKFGADKIRFIEKEMLGQKLNNKIYYFQINMSLNN